MCEPATLALLVGTAANAAAGTAATAGLIGSAGAIGSGFMAATTAASAVAGLASQKMAADAQTSANQRQYDSTMRAYASNLSQTNLMQLQEREGSMQKLDENNMAARSAMSTARVSAGENGISGLSVDALLSDLSGKQNRYNTSVDTNYDRATSAINNQRENVYSNAASSINGLKTPAAPDYLGTGLRIATGIYDYQNPKVK